MPIHDWTRVDAGIFHAFHHSWIEEISRSLNRGLLPPEYYALAELITGNTGPDVLTFQRPVYSSLSGESAPTAGGVAVDSEPPKARFHARTEIDEYATKAKAVVIRHRSNHRVIAIVEIVSPGNKISQSALSAFVYKADQALLAGVHLLIVDLFPPNSRDPDSIHRSIWGEGRPADFALPEDKSLSCSYYVGSPGIEVYFEPVAVGDPVPDMPLFLTPEVYVLLSLDNTYRSAWEAFPAFWREVLTAPPPPDAGHGKSRLRRR
jgi:hypothetical protein